VTQSVCVSIWEHLTRGAERESKRGLDPTDSQAFLHAAGRASRGGPRGDRTLVFGFGEGDGACGGYKSDRDQMFGGRDRDGRGRHGQLRPRDDTLGQGDLRDLWVGYLVLADVAVQCRQQHGAEYDGERGL